MKILITGASSGIGEALAVVGAGRKHDLIIVARRKDRLESLSTSLQQRHNIDVEVIAADLTMKNQRKIVIDRINQGDIDILINNAGFGTSGPFAELEISRQLNEIDLNVSALVELTDAAVKSMVPRGYGTVVNVSSIASYVPMAGNAVYGATKAFVTSFTHAVREELSESGVNIMAVCPGMTESEFFERSGWPDASKNDPHLALIWQSSMDVAKATFRGIDHQQGIVIPGAVNKLLASVASSLPGSVTRKVTALIAKGRRLR